VDDFDVDEKSDFDIDEKSDFDLERRSRRAEAVRKDLSMQKTEGGVFSYATLQAVGKLGSEGFIDRIMGPVSTGKEADVFAGMRGDKKIAIKVFRLASASYFRNPTVLEYIMGDERFRKMKRTPRELIGLWSLKEFRNLKKAEEAKVRAPKPLAIEKNVLVMGFVGDDDAAPRLTDSEVEEPEKLFKEIIGQVKKMYGAGLVHADLSEYNILLWKGKPYLIDFGQGVLLNHPRAGEFLERDVGNICSFFRKRGVKCDFDKVLAQIKGNNPRKR
jgi:RIO kinase 1